MTPPIPIGVGVIGLGFMGRTHVAAYQSAAAAGYPCRLVAVCDPSHDRLTGQSGEAGNLATGADRGRLFDPTLVHAYADPERLLADSAVHLVSICTYTETHVDLALRALAAGKHVLVEKPVALRSPDVRRLADGADASGRLCMPAMCVRFWPGWDWLHDTISNNSLGAVRSAVFQRLGSGPRWAADFYRDYSRSGGALYDLHVHDVDFIYWCFGRPDAISSTGSLDHLTTHFRFQKGCGPRHVTAEGGWDLAPAAGFRMRFLVAFEQGTADYDLARQPPVLLHRAYRSEPISIGPVGPYDAEVRHLIDAIATGRTDLRATLADAVAVTELLEAQRRSLDTGLTVTT